MKTCTKCDISKEESQFRFRNKAKGKLAPWCKDCFSSHEKERWANDPNRRPKNVAANNIRRLRNQQMVWDYLKANPCPCGEKDPILLEFDHRDRKNKRMDICTMARTSYGPDTIMDEIAKCDVLCVSCHRRRTAAQFDWYKNIIR